MCGLLCLQAGFKIVLRNERQIRMMAAAFFNILTKVYIIVTVLKGAKR